MFPTISQYAVALEELAAGKRGEERKKIIENLLTYLKRRGEEKELPKIVECLEKISDRKEKKVRVTAITAHPVSAWLQKKLQARAQTIFSQENVAMTFQVDPEVIGGVALRTDEKLYDATLKTELKKLKKELSQE